MVTARRWGALYLGAQGLGILAWWLALGILPAWRESFRDPAAPLSALVAFAPGDLLLGLGSLIAAWALARRRPGRRALLWLVAGAMTYAAFYCLTLTGLTGRALVAPMLMVPAALASLAVAWAEEQARQERS